MAAVRTAARGLSTSDLERIRDALATGRKPKVVFTEAAQPPTGKAAADKATADKAAADRSGAEPAKARPARKAGRPKAPASLTVTLAYTDGEWTVAAQQGAKALAKPYVIKPAEALKM